MKKTHSTLVIAIISILIACNSENNPSDKDQKSDNANALSSELLFEKLTGTWQNTDGSSFEKWQKKSDGTFQSVAYSIKGTDTTLNEEVMIYMQNDKWVYEVTVAGQKDPKSVKFISVSLTKTSVQFNNPTHDFPNDIAYNLENSNTLNAFIIGRNNKGGLDTVPFSFKRIQ